MGPVLLWGPPLGDDPGAAVKSSSLLVVSTLNSTDIFLILAGKICYLPNSGWALAVKIKILGFPDRAILLIQTLHYTVINGYNGRNPRCDNNLGKLERYRLVTIRGGERDWSLNPHFQWFIFRIPGWHCIAGVLLSAEGVILSAEGVLLSGHIEFPGHITLQVSFCVTLSFLVTCHGHGEFPGHLSIITWMDT